MRFWLSLVFLLLLTACAPPGPTQDQLRKTATWAVYNNNIETIVAGTATARAPTETPVPPPKLLSLSELILTKDELADIYAWDDYVVIENDSYANFIDYADMESREFCPKTCFGRIWTFSEDYLIGVMVVISSFYTEESTLAAFEKILLNEEVAPQKVSEYPDLVGFPIPEDSLLIKHEHTWVSIVSHQGSFIVFADVMLAEKSQLENIYSAAVVTERQLKKLENPMQ